MNDMWSGIIQGFSLLFPPSEELLQIVFLSVFVSGTATALAGFVAVPVASWLVLSKSRLRRVYIAIFNTMLSIPAVLIGLLVYILVSRRGLLGFMGLLFTPGAMILAQTLLAIPLIVALTHSALQGSVKETRDLAYSLGANRWQMLLAIIRAGRFSFLTALITGFSRVIGETGMTLMVGGNIKGHTRVMTTAISLETMKGNFEYGIALGMILLLVALLINIVLQYFQGKS